MSGPLIVPIVEGHGEVEALPLLIRRVFNTFLPGVIPAVNPPNRVKSGSFLNDQDYFSKYIALAGAKAAQGNGTILILLDCEDHCPGTLGPQLLERANGVRPDVPCIITLAHREYETWFVATVDSLRDFAGLPPDIAPPENPEGIRGAKEWLAKRMPIAYDPIVHQARFTAKFDLQKARAIPSFDRLIVKLIGLQYNA